MKLNKTKQNYSRIHICDHSFIGRKVITVSTEVEEMSITCSLCRQKPSLGKVAVKKVRGITAGNMIFFTSGVLQSSLTRRRKAELYNEWHRNISVAQIDRKH